ncbi:MAG: dihydropteroate synthase [Actinomycetota bacterium]
MSERIWRCRDHAFELGARTLVMGVLNVTPDSFSDGGLYADAAAAVAHGARMADDGADIVDVGGESTRPGAAPVAVDEELQRVLPVIKGLRASRPDLVVSIDTRHSRVAKEAVAAGASIVNDISGALDPAMADVVKDAGTGLVLMHMQGDPRTMQVAPHYDDVVAEVHEFLRERVESAVFAGIASEYLCVDPGIGFGKDLEHNLALLRAVERFADLDAAVMVGASRKQFIGALTEVEDPAARVEGSIAAAVLSVGHGADAVRVHDVAETVRALRVADAIVRDGA